VKRLTKKPATENEYGPLKNAALADHIKVWNWRGRIDDFEENTFFPESLFLGILQIDILRFKSRRD